MNEEARLEIVMAGTTARKSSWSEEITVVVVESPRS